MQVYFGRNYWSDTREEEACSRVKTEKSFEWNGWLWRVLGDYVCNKGLVLDFGRQLEPEKLSTFLEKWKHCAGEEVSPYQEAWLEYENPMEEALNPRIWINGKECAESRGCGVSYVPQSVVHFPGKRERSSLLKI